MFSKISAMKEKIEQWLNYDKYTRSYSEYNRKVLLSRFVGTVLDLLLCSLVLLLLKWGDHVCWGLFKEKNNIFITLLNLVVGGAYRLHLIYFPCLFVVLSFCRLFTILGFLWNTLRKRRCNVDKFDSKFFWKCRLHICLAAIYGAFWLVGILIVAIFTGGSSEETLYDEYGNEVTIRR